MSFFQDHEDPDAWYAKRAGKVPVLLVEKTRVYLIIGKVIISEIDEGKLDEGVLALLASFYMFDSDYPRCQEIGLTLICSIAFSRTKMSQLILHVQFKTVLLYLKLSIFYIMQFILIVLLEIF